MILLAFVFSIGGILLDTAHETAKRDAYFQEQETALAEGRPVFAGPYCFPDPHPKTLYWISFLTGLSLLVSCHRRFWMFATLPVLGTISVFLYWYFDTQQLLISNEFFRPILIDRFLYRANFLDLGVLTLISSVLMLQLSFIIPKFHISLRSRPLP